MISFGNTLKTTFISLCQFNQIQLSVSTKWKTCYLRSSVSYSYIKYKQIQCSLINATGSIEGAAFELYPEDREEIHHGNNSRGRSCGLLFLLCLEKHLKLLPAGAGGQGGE